MAFLPTAHRDLYEKAGILHRDISLENLMVDPNNHRKGILVDLDIAARVRDGDKRLNPVLTYAGTLPFRGIDLLREDTHYPTRAVYRDDLESFFYVLFYIQKYYRDGRRLPTHDTLRWSAGDEPGDIADLGTRKLGWLWSTSIPESPLRSDWVAPLRDFIVHAYEARRDFNVRKMEQQTILRRKAFESETGRSSARHVDLEDSGDDGLAAANPNKQEGLDSADEWGVKREETLDDRFTFESFMNLIR